MISLIGFNEVKRKLVIAIKRARYMALLPFVKE